MKKILVLLFALSGTWAYSQKKIEVNKSTIEVDGQVVAEFDSKGGILSANRKIWLLSPATKDTLLIIYPMTTEVDNPMVELDVLYKLAFYNPEKTTFRFQNPKGWGAVKESKVVGLIFNEKLPLLIENGKLSETGMAAFREKAGFNMEEIFENVKQVNDSIVATNKSTVKRDRTKPVIMKQVNKGYLPKLYIAGSSAHLTFEIWQGDVLIGVLEKETTGGGFAKGKYKFYKAVAPFKVGDKDIRFIPVAFSETSPGITSAVTSGEISVTQYSINFSFNIPPGAYNTSEYAIANALIGRGIL